LEATKSTVIPFGHPLEYPAGVVKPAALIHRIPMHAASVSDWVASNWIPPERRPLPE
jgi:hypothetical protein